MTGVFGLLFAAAPGLAREFADAEALLRCAAANAPAADEVRSLRLVSRDRLARERATHLNVFARAGGGAVLLRFTEPAALAGSTMLVVNTASGYEFHLHSSAMGTTRRIAGRELAGTLFGTDFSAEDMSRFQGLEPWSRARLRTEADPPVGGREVVTLDLAPDPKRSAYERVVGRFDAERCVPLEIEMYEGDGRLRKRLVTEAVTRVGERWIPERAVLRDERDHTRTEISLVTVFDKLAIPESVFDVHRFGVEAPHLELEGPDHKPAIRIEIIKPEAP